MSRGLPRRTADRKHSYIARCGTFPSGVPRQRPEPKRLSRLSPVACQRILPDEVPELGRGGQDAVMLATFSGKVGAASGVLTGAETGIGVGLGVV